MRNKETLNEIRRYKRHAEGLTDDSLITDIRVATNYVFGKQFDASSLSNKAWLITLEFAVKELNRRIDN